MSFPSAAEEELVDTLSLDEFLIKNRDATYILKVKSDSMADAGIYEGDLVLVERGVKPKPGNIVIAQVDGEYTMKYYRDIHPTDELKVEAVVRTVIRQY